MFDKIANLKSITTNNCHTRTCSMQTHKHIECCQVLREVASKFTSSSQIQLINRLDRNFCSRYLLRIRNMLEFVAKSIRFP